MGDNKLDDLIPKGQGNSKGSNSQEIPTFNPRVTNEGANANIVQRDSIPSFKSEARLYEMDISMAREIVNKSKNKKK